jgi:CubicO group peptidase (beta-lactamase class C family)
MIGDIDAIVEAQFEANGPGAAVAVINDGVLLHCKGYGLANLEWGNAIQPDTVFRLASITKQFTATAIMLLEQQGKLSVDDALTNYLPDYPTSGHDIRLHHLLTHTSGIKSYTSIESFFGNLSAKDLSPQQLADVFKNEPFDFAPGAEYRYNNSGYALLGMIIEQVTGMSYADAIRDLIFKPAGMEHSYYLSNEPIIPHRASGYVRSGSNFQNATYLSMTGPYSAGALGSTVADLVLWDRVLTESLLLDQPTLERMYTPAKLNDGKAIDYGFGWSLATYNGHRIAHHGGGIFGFSTYIARFPDDRATVIVLSNLGGTDVEQLTRKISRLLLGLPAIVRQPVALDAQVAGKATGRYADTFFSADIIQIEDALELRGEGLHLHLAPLDAARFYAMEDIETELYFSEDAEGVYQKLTIRFPFDSHTFSRIASGTGDQV